MQTKLYKRKCYDCGNDFETNHKISYCNDCYKIKQKVRYHNQKIGRIPKPMGRKPYPLSPEETRLRFVNRRKEIEKITVRGEWKKLLSERFTNLLTNEIEIYEWAKRNEPDSYYEKHKQRILQKYKENKEVDKPKDE
jgi:hypothetical protein